MPSWSRPISALPGSVLEVTFITGRAEHTRVLLSFWLAAEVPAEVLHPLAQAAAEATRGGVPQPFPDPQVKRGCTRSESKRMTFMCCAVLSG